MARDFTLSSFRNLLQTLSGAGYSFSTVAGYARMPRSRTVVLRHDVDASPGNSICTALSEKALGIRGTYYFRYGRHGFDSGAIRQISGMGHEAGYHYEDLAFAWRRANRADREQETAAAAFESFRFNLHKLREIAEIETICMHGSPMSPADSRLMWRYFDYKDHGIMTEPYMDISFEDMLYLTDTGRRWDGSAFSLRDKAGFAKKGSPEGYGDWKVVPLQGSLMNMTDRSAALQAKYQFHETADIEKAARAAKLPDKIMMTVHPQRWDDMIIPWLSELISQKAKNSVKYFLIKIH
jgi:hypothetical protein